MDAKAFQRILELNKEAARLRNQLNEVTDELWNLGLKLPRHPLEHGSLGIAATINYIAAGRSIVCLDLVKGSGHVVQILYVNADRLLVEDVHFGWGLEQLGVIPDADGNWSEGCICIRNEQFKLLQAIPWLNDIGTAEAAKLLEFIKKHLKDFHGVPMD